MVREKDGEGILELLKRIHSLGMKVSKENLSNDIIPGLIKLDEVGNQSYLLPVLNDMFCSG